MKWLVLLSLLFLAGCGDYPRDVEGTLDRVRAERTFRVGIIAGAPADERTRAEAFLSALGQATGARPAIVAGAAEPLLLRLEQGSLDLVIGPLAEETPWAKNVSVIEPLVQRSAGEARLGLSPVARNGENQWIMLIERVVRDQGGVR